MEVLDIVGALIAELRAALDVLSQVGFRLAATLAGISLLFGLSAVIGGGANAFAYVTTWIIRAGLIGAAISFGPLIAQETYATADEIIQVVTGTGVAALDVLQRGVDIVARVWDHGVTGSAYNPINWIQWWWTVLWSLFLLIPHAWLSLLIAWAALYLWLAAALSPLLIPLLWVPPLAAAGAQGLTLLVSSAVRLIVLGIIVGITGDVFLDVVIPDGASELTMIDLFGATVTTGVITVLAWTASSTAAAIARGAAPQTGFNAIAGTIMGVALGRGIGSSAGFVQAGRAASGSAPTPPAPSPGGAGGGGRGGRPGGGSGVVGSTSRAA
jgi:hypothetical protein